MVCVTMDVDDIATLCHGLSIKEKKKSVLTLDGNLKDKEVQRLELCLVGKVFSTKLVNRNAFMDVMNKIWRVERGVEIEQIKDNIFEFCFKTLKDRQRILKVCLWSFDKAIIVFEKPIGEGDAEDMWFNSVDFWVQIHNLPLLYMTYEIGKFLDANWRLAVWSRAISHPKKAYMGLGRGDNRKWGKSKGSGGFKTDNGGNRRTYDNWRGNMNRTVETDSEDRRKRVGEMHGVLEEARALDNGAICMGFDKWVVAKLYRRMGLLGQPNRKIQIVPWPEAQIWARAQIALQIRSHWVIWKRVGQGRSGVRRTENLGKKLGKRRSGDRVERNVIECKIFRILPTSIINGTRAAKTLSNKSEGDENDASKAQKVMAKAKADQKIEVSTTNVQESMASDSARTVTQLKVSSVAEKVKHLEFWGSDHRPLVLYVCEGSYKQKTGRRFYFEECWIEDEECKAIVEATWDESGNWKNSKADMELLASDYFGRMLSSSNPTVDDLGKILNGVNLRLDSNTSRFLDAEFTREEVQKSIFDMNPIKAPSSDGLPVIFYQKY
ncbi:hypothetical protein Dsin_015561 [Dipteronia sinensis]|uniref:DUF4283 domain-containing protein n=1 Tax=Dipteronia sinensis TaxID=43782 RepID=A0AAE0ABH0_9ROSI|nr:hypothetical protein Dsin_015561 [Dipteronia sinensis]